MLAPPAPHVPRTCPHHTGSTGLSPSGCKTYFRGENRCQGPASCGFLPAQGWPEPCPELQETRGLTREPRRAGRATKCHPGGGSGEGEACPMQVSLPRAAWPWPTPGMSHRPGGQWAAQLAQGGRRPGSSEVMGENRRWKNWGGNSRGHSLLLAPGPGPTLEEFNTDRKGTMKAPHVLEPRLLIGGALLRADTRSRWFCAPNTREPGTRQPLKQALIAPAGREDGQRLAVLGSGTNGIGHQGAASAHR